jgi:hypothetical protein
MTAALKAGVAYFAIVFAAGFILGTVRVHAVAPCLGETGAVLIELPVMLALSWLFCGKTIEHFAVAAEWPARLTMGAAAFALLMLAELCLSLFLFGRSIAEFLTAFNSWAGALGLAGQFAFAAFPIIQTPGFARR